LTLAAHLPFATVHLPFLLNTVALFYNFGKSWKSDPGIIKASEEQKKKVTAAGAAAPRGSMSPLRLRPSSAL